MTVFLEIDRIACDGRGACAELLPELVDLDDWGYPLVADGPVPGALLEHARRALELCPVLALRLRRADPLVGSVARPTRDGAVRSGGAAQVTAR